jgi:hypothetical protein
MSNTGYSEGDDNELEKQRQIRRNVFMIILIAAIQAAMTTMGALLFDALSRINW